MSELPLRMQIKKSKKAMATHCFFTLLSKTANLYRFDITTNGTGYRVNGTRYAVHGEQIVCRVPFTAYRSPCTVHPVPLKLSWDSNFLSYSFCIYICFHDVHTTVEVVECEFLSLRASRRKTSHFLSGQ